MKNLEVIIKKIKIEGTDHKVDIINIVKYLKANYIEKELII